MFKNEDSDGGWSSERKPFFFSKGWWELELSGPGVKVTHREVLCVFRSRDSGGLCVVAKRADHMTSCFRDLGGRSVEAA